MQPQRRDRRRELLADVAKRLAWLVSREPDEDEQKAMMDEAEHLLHEANMLDFTPRRNDGPRQWARELIEDNPEMIDQDAAQWALEHGLRPSRCQCVHELITSLIPSEGGL